MVGDQFAKHDGKTVVSISLESALFKRKEHKGPNILNTLLPPIALFCLIPFCLICNYSPFESAMSKHAAYLCVLAVVGVDGGGVVSVVHSGLDLGCVQVIDGLAALGLNHLIR